MGCSIGGLANEAQLTLLPGVSSVLRVIPHLASVCRLRCALSDGTHGPRLWCPVLTTPGVE